MHPNKQKIGGALEEYVGTLTNIIVAKHLRVGMCRGSNFKKHLYIQFKGDRLQINVTSEHILIS